MLGLVSQEYIATLPSKQIFLGIYSLDVAVPRYGKIFIQDFLGPDGLYLHQTKQTDCLVHRQLICELGHPSSTRFPVLQHHQHTAVPVDLPTIAWELLTSTAH